MNILEIIGAFVLFFAIVGALLTQIGVLKWTVERTND